MTATLLSSLPFTPSRAAALQRLSDFVPLAGAHYAAGRNTDYGPDHPASVSRLSPYLRYRLITEEETVRAVLQHHSYEAAEKFIQEVLWRTYWKGWLAMRPEVWHRYQRECDVLKEQYRDDPALKAAEQGETGIEGFDQWAKELVQTGYLHNHARMWFASIWIFTLNLPWALGAAFFLRHLLDADAASNTLSWRWVAGLQTPGKTYLATTENIARFTNGRFFPKGLALSADARVEPPLAAPKPLSALKPLESTAPTILLLHADDLHPELYRLKKENVRVVFFVNDRRLFWGEKAHDFIAASHDDLKKRIAQQYDLPLIYLSTDSTNQLMDYAKSNAIKQIVTPYAPEGLVSVWLRSFELDLSTAGLSLFHYRRMWDETFWPHATKGFFSFKEKIPTILRELGRL
ncbi:MAG: FAD-binding domain-containing protein [Alphaproteobacteria bacterium]